MARYNWSRHPGWGTALHMLSDTLCARPCRENETTNETDGSGSGKLLVNGMVDFSFVVFPSRFGTFAILWQEVNGRPRVERVFLSTGSRSAEQRLRAYKPSAKGHSHSAIAELGEQIQAFLSGQPIQFPLDSIALEHCSRFQQRVLIAEHGIPRGRVSTYGLIAAHLGLARGARAVGSALAHNPFPLIIPCHRAIRSDGSLGGYQGGLTMKRLLLEMEGLELSPTGRVVTAELYYSTSTLPAS